MKKIFEEMKWYFREAVDGAPDEPAIYVLAWYDDNSGYRLQYIGESAILRQRLKQHLSKPWWNCFTWEPGSRSQRERKGRESKLIDYYNPPKNERA